MRVRQAAIYALPLLALSVGLAGTPHRAEAASESVIYSFQNTPQDGRYPNSDLTKVGANLYGTDLGTKNCSTYISCGAIFKIKPGGSATTIHQFKRSAGWDADSGLLAVGETLYGTTNYGGAGTCANVAPGCGSLYALDLPKNFTEILDFPNTIGPPTGGVSTDGSNFYGVTLPAYQNNVFGTVYSITKTGTVTVIYNFQDNGPGGFYASAPPTPVNGTLYGTTSSGGADYYGTVYAIAPNGTETVLHSFSGAGDGGYPMGKLLRLNGILYGTASGTLDQCQVKAGCGAIFEILADGTEQLLYSFTGKSDGQVPNADLTVLNGVIYGTTQYGAKDSTGTVFSLTPGGAFKTIYTFKGSPDGESPQAGLLTDGNLLYGTTFFGGTAGYGTVYSITP